jgi:hypothetical protein
LTRTIKYVEGASSRQATSSITGSEFGSKRYEI